MKNKILFIDDEVDILEAVKIILESQGLIVKTATDIESIESIIEFSPDLILLDILLVGKSGKEVNQKLKEFDETKEIPVMLLSAHPLSKLKKLAVECNAVDYLQKPFDMDVLIKAVKKNLN